MEQYRRANTLVPNIIRKKCDLLVFAVISRHLAVSSITPLFFILYGLSLLCLSLFPLLSCGHSSALSIYDTLSFLFCDPLFPSSSVSSMLIPWKSLSTLVSFSERFACLIDSRLLLLMHFCIPSVPFAVLNWFQGIYVAHTIFGSPIYSPHSFSR